MFAFSGGKDDGKDDGKYDGEFNRKVARHRAIIEIVLNILKEIPAMDGHTCKEQSRKDAHDLITMFNGLWKLYDIQAGKPKESKEELALLEGKSDGVEPLSYEQRPQDGEPKEATERTALLARKPDRVEHLSYDGRMRVLFCICSACIFMGGIGYVAYRSIKACIDYCKEDKKSLNYRYKELFDYLNTGNEDTKEIRREICQDFLLVLDNWLPEYDQDNLNDVTVERCLDEWYRLLWLEQKVEQNETSSGLTPGARK